LSIEEEIERSNENLSEKCRVSLEKNFGFQIPLPKCVKKAPKEKVVYGYQRRSHV